METFVCVNLFGGLGNQLFQYSAGKRVAKLTNSSLLVNKETENAHNVNGHNYATELFRDAIEVDWPRGPLGEWLFRSQNVHVVSQQDGFGAWDPTTISSPCVLNGYFQYYPAIFPILEDVVEQIKANGPHYPEEAATFLHIRRGDYVEKSDFHYLQGQDYYEKAIAHLKPTKLLIFSDDISWCKEQTWLQKQENIEFVEEVDEIKAFFRMASCKEGCILANSTFSWWAAIVSGCRRVVYPSRWIRQPIVSLFPEHWTCIT